MRESYKSLTTDEKLIVGPLSMIKICVNTILMPWNEG